MTTKDILQELLKGQQETQRDIKAMQGDIRTVQGDIRTVQGDIRTVQGDIKAMQRDLKLLFEGQRGLKEEIAVHREETSKGFKGTHERIDNLGKQLAYLEDDAPTRDEFDKLKKLVKN